jgi:hypothetical protein
MWRNREVVMSEVENRPLMTIAKHPSGFVLYERGQMSGEWRSLKLVLCDDQQIKKRRNWWLGWNGERLARNEDARNLSKRNPAIYAWVVETLKVSNKHIRESWNAGDLDTADPCPPRVPS